MLLERRFAEKKVVMAGLSAESPTCAQRNCSIVGLGEDSVASGDQEKPFAVADFVEEETAGAFDPGCRLSTDGDTECDGEGLAAVHCRVDVEGVLEELGTDRANDFRLAYLDVEVVDAVF